MINTIKKLFTNLENLRKPIPLKTSMHNSKTSLRS